MVLANFNVDPDNPDVIDVSIDIDELDAATVAELLKQGSVLLVLLEPGGELSIEEARAKLHMLRGGTLQ